MTYRAALEQILTAQLRAKYSDPLAYATVAENGRLAFLNVSGKPRMTRKVSALGVEIFQTGSATLSESDSLLEPES